MSARLVACPSCSNLVKQSEPACIICGARMRNDRGAKAFTASAMLMGLSLTGCPADDTMGDSMASEDGTATPMTDTGTDTGTGTTMAESMSSTTAGTETGTTMADSSESTSFSTESAYGVPGTGTTIAETDSESETDTTTATDTDPSTGSTSAEEGSTSVSPDYGVPETQ